MARSLDALLHLRQRVTGDVPLYERDPDAWAAHLAEGNRTQARKRVSADVLFRDVDGRILLVDPHYKPGWDLPGGMAEANEAPRDAARREVREELGIDLPDGRLLVVDWVPPHGPWDDSLAFVFDGGLRRPSRGDILLDGEELAAYRFYLPGEAADLLSPRTWRRVEQALGAVKTGTTRYLHDGRPG